MSRAALGPGAIAVSISNLVEIGLIGLLLGDQRGASPFDRSGSIFRFTLCAGFAASLSGAIATLTLTKGLDWAAALTVAQWALAHVLGLIIITPLVLAALRSNKAAWTIGALVEPAALLLLAAGTSAIIFSGTEQRQFLLFPILLLAGFRLRVIPAALIGAATGAVAYGFTAQGLGPIASAASTVEGQTFLLQAHFAVSLLLTIPLSAIKAERNRLQQALAANERQFRLIAEASLAGVLQCGLDGTPLFANRRWTDLTGFTLGDVHKSGWQSVICEPDRGRASALWQQVRERIAEGRDCLPCQLHGRAGWAEIYITPDLEEDGAVVGWVVQLMDVTDRVEARQALKESEALYRLLAENSRDIIMRLDLAGTKLFVSKASTTMLGVRPEALIGKPLSSLVHPDDWASVEQSLEHLVVDDSRQAVRYRKRKANGRYLWVEAVYHLIRDPVSGLPLEIIASVRDIDHRYKAELLATESSIKLRERNRLLTMAEEMAEVGHWRFNQPEVALEFSLQAADIAGLSRASALSPAAAMEMVAPNDRWRVKRALVAAIHGEASCNCRVRVLRDDGSERIIDFAVQAEQRAEDGSVSGVFGVIQDITQKVADERFLVDALDKANEATRAKSVFLATMSHEIRTPMTGVIGMIDLLRDNPSEAERESFLATLKQSANLLMSVINDVLDFSKMEHGGLEIRTSDFDFELLAQSAVDLLTNAASQKGLPLSLEIDSGASSFVHGDPVRLQQVISNLINNAIKFTDSGKVAVRIKARPAGSNRQSWRVEVSDTGIGIPANQVAALFEPFSQAEQGPGRRFGGTGLGLAISRQLIEAMDGQIGFVDAGGAHHEGPGSTFWFEIQLDEAHASVVQDRRLKDEAPADGPLRVLVAEDNPVNQLLITALLRRQGHVPTCVDDGRKAVDAAAAEAFDCILMDMQMPVMDGITATRTIRQSGGPCATVPIIALTADASPERRRFYDNAGLTGFMTKPIDGAELSARLAAIAASAPASITDGVLDEGHLDELEQVLGNKRLRGLIDLFLCELAEKPDHIRDHLLAGRLDQAATEAHSLKGAAFNMGAPQLGEAAAEIERLNSAVDIKAITRLLVALDGAVRAARAALESRGIAPELAIGA